VQGLLGHGRVEFNIETLTDLVPDLEHQASSGAFVVALLLRFETRRAGKNFASLLQRTSLVIAAHKQL
jgi:hypothetical protein